MKSITHYLSRRFLNGTGYERPEDLELRSRVGGGERRLVLLTFVDASTGVDNVQRPLLRVPLLPEEARDIASTLYELAREARCEHDE